MLSDMSSLCMPNRRVSRTGLRCALALIAIPIVFGQTPVPGPALNFVTPITAPAGSSGFVLNLSGSNFVAGSQAFWNTVPLPTSFISAGQLSASVTPNLLLAPGQVSVYVRNPNGTQ